jgi:hypothetical protein
MFAERRKAIRLLFVSVALALVGCAPGPSPSLEPSAGSVVRFDHAAMAEGGALLTLDFVGGAVYSPDKPCTHAYTGWARLSGDELEAAVVKVGASSNGPCDLVGHARTDSRPRLIDMTAMLNGRGRAAPSPAARTSRGS